MSDSNAKNSPQPPPAPTSANELKRLEDEIERLTRRHDMPRRIELCRQALALVERESSPEQWASWHYELAYSLDDNPLGSRADNLEQAIHHYKQALEVYTRQAYPENWATMQNNLAITYCLRIRGERHDNLEQAIHHYGQALEVRTRQADPEGWAITQNNLANAYSKRIKGEQRDNLEQAIYHYKQALEVTTRQADPEQWAMTQNNFSQAYRNRIKGERRDNLEQAIFHVRQALEVYTRQAYPEDWALMQNNLAIAYSDRIKGERRDNLEQAIFHARQALEVRTRQAYPEQWADTQNNLASAYLYRIRGERRDNLEQAIHHYKQALEVTTRQAYPEQWATTQNNLASAYLYRIKGERRDNLEQAIHHYKQALEVRMRQAYPKKWADTQNNLGEAYRNRIKGERRDNLEQAIDHYGQALEVTTRQAYPKKWADTQNNLAIAYRNRIKGERRDNLEQAIHHHGQALEMYTRQAYPEKWAMMQNNLANAYSGRIKGELRDNLEQAIHHYGQALEVYTRQAYPEKWAMTQNNLALALNNRIKGERRNNLEQAIHHYKQTLEVHTRQAYPEYWADTQNNLAGAFRNRIKGERRDNLEQAIHHYKQALEMYTRQAYPEKWAMIQNNLARTLFNRIRGEHGDNLERAISHYKQALEVYTRQAYPEGWANTQNNLASALRNRIRGERGDNLESAISHYKQALEVYTRQAYPEKWAAIQNNFAITLKNRVRGERGDNLEQAIHHYKQALEVYTRQAFPEKWAMTQNNFANALKDRIKGERGDNLEQAIHHYKQALEVYTRQAFPEKWAMTQYNLAIAYQARSRFKRGDMSRAIFHYRQALEVRTPQSFPQDCRDTAYWLGRLLYDEGRFAEAREAFVTGHEAVEALRGEVVREGSRRELADENADLYARLVYCCLHDGDEEAAFEYAAAGKGRAFADRLASARFDLFAAEVDDPVLAADLQAYRELRQQIDNLHVQLTGNRGRAGDTSGRDESERIRLATLSEQLGATQKKAAEHWQEMTFRYPALTACQSAPSLSAQDARQLSAQLGATLVEYYRHAEGWCAFVVMAVLRQAQEPEVRYVALPEVTDGLLEQMDNWKKALSYPAGRADWTIEALEDCYEAVLAPLIAHVVANSASSEARRPRVVLAPFKELGDLPLFAARDPEDERYLAERYQLAFVPSLGALHVAQKLAERERRKHSMFFDALLKLLSVAYPGTPALPNVIPEADAVTKCFGQAIQLKEKAATPQAVLRETRDHRPHALHLGCHGRFNEQNPAESGLMLAGGRLTLQQIIIEMQLDECHLVTLSACESWVLTQAFMSAGAPTVISSQWRVNDSATRALFEAFYAHLTNHYSPASALREATRLIRQQEGWQHPYYWAPFIVNGLAHQAIPSAEPSGCVLDDIQQQVETLNRQSTRLRAAEQGANPQMDFEDLERIAYIYLNGMVSRTVRKKLNLADAHTIVAQLASLSQQAATLQTQRDLFALYEQIHQLVEKTDVLRHQLIPKNANIAQMEKDRFTTKEDFDKTRGPQQLDPKVVSTIQQTLTKTKSKVEAPLASLENLQAKTGSR